MCVCTCMHTCAVQYSTAVMSVFVCELFSIAVILLLLCAICNTAAVILVYALYSKAVILVYMCVWTVQYACILGALMCVWTVQYGCNPGICMCVWTVKLWSQCMFELYSTVVISFLIWRNYFSLCSRYEQIMKWYFESVSTLFLRNVIQK